MPLDDKELWNWAVHQDDIIVSRFEIGVVAIGALFVAYAEVQSFALKEIITLIGFVASLILFMNICGSIQEIYAAWNKKSGVLRADNKDFFIKFDEIKQSKYNSCWYFPVTKLMAYFTFIVSIMWLGISVFLAFRFLNIF
jgi:hypothetical protein